MFVIIKGPYCSVVYMSCQKDLAGLWCLSYEKGPYWIVVHVMLKGPYWIVMHMPYKKGLLECGIYVIIKVPYWIIVYICHIKRTILDCVIYVILKLRTCLFEPSKYICYIDIAYN